MSKTKKIVICIALLAMIAGLITVAATLFAIESPSPLPPVSLERELSPR